MSLTSITYGLAALMGFGIIVIGMRALLVPRAAASGFFGIPIRKDGAAFDAYMAIKGVRDIGVGLITFALLITATAHVLGWFVVATTAIPLGDAVIVLRHSGSKAAAVGIHGATAAVMLVLAAALLLS
ncbi:MAG: DUF4267 domain-containing protein [Dehalococcoidia bacterium]